MLSHISNAEVRRIANASPLTQKILYRQLLNFGKMAKATNESEVRQIIFQPDSVKLVEFDGKRSRGRPRLRWETAMYAHAVQAAETVDNLNSILRDQKSWQAVVRKYSLSLIHI